MTDAPETPIPPSTDPLHPLPPFAGRTHLSGFLAATAVPVLLLAALASYLIGGLLDDLEHSRGERRGLHIAHALYHVMGRFQELRGLELMYDSGSRGVEEQIRGAQEELAAALDELADDAATAEFGIRVEIEELQRHNVPEFGATKGNTPDTGKRHYALLSEAIAEVRVAQALVADRSGLILPRELDGRYLVDLAVYRLGEFSDSVGETRAIAAGILATGRVTPPDLATLHGLTARMEGALDQVRHDMDVVTATAPHLADVFRPFRVQIERRSELFSKELGRVEAGMPGIPMERLFELSTPILAITEVLHDRAVDLMDGILAHREAELRGNVQAVVAAAGVIALVMILLITFYYRTNQRSVRQRDETIHLLDVIGSAQTEFINRKHPQEAFDLLLTGLLDLTESEYGFIGEVLHGDDGNPYLKSRAITNIAWNEETRRFYDQEAPRGLEFFNLKTLFGAVMTSGEPVVTNDPANDPRRGGLPEGHPDLNAFLGVPIYKGAELIGMAGIANRPGGYSRAMIAGLRPYLSTCAHLISAHRTERAVADSDERHRAVITTMVDAVVVIDDMGTIERFNPAAERMFGYAAREVIGQNVNILMPEPYHSEHDGYLERYNTTGDARILGIGREVSGRRKDGSVFPLDLAVNQMEVAGSRMYVGILRDISERKRMEAMKGEFISTVSHELRTPLTSIRGALGLLRGGAAGPIPDKAAELLGIAHNNTERLLLLINDILDIDKIESGNMPFRFVPTELAAFIQEAVTSHEGYAQQHGVTFSITGVDTGLAVNADPDRMMQVLANLLSNAAKFSPEGGVVEVSARRRNGMVRICVTDSGPGIPEEFQARVFEKFTQSDATDTRVSGGTGLGLSIARAIVEKHGGTIGFSTVVGAGTTFHVDLPEVGDSSPSRPQGEPSVDERSSVLIVEDDADVARIISRMLATDGVRSDVATSGEAGLKMLERHPYKVITLDLRLPGMSGVEFINALRRKPHTRRVPVVVVSAYAGTAQGELEGGAADIFDWLEKPIDETRLLLAVREAGQGGTARVLHVEDEPDVRRVVSLLLEGKATVRAAATLAEARKALAEDAFDLILLDQGLPDGNGVDLLEDVQKLTADKPRVVVFSALEVTRETQERVDAVLMKSTTSNARLFDTIKAYL
ncbi:MAG: response regulator [Nitrospirota bacterium]|nr:response regulator [Nitrospirota bacterium]